jgi:hypothetical protein
MINSSVLGNLIFGALSAIFLVGTQFYIFPSGTPQPAHYLGLIFLLLVLLDSSGRFVVKDNITKLFIIFIFYSFFLNLFFSMLHGTIDFLRDSIFILYNFLVFLSVYYALRKYRQVPYFVLWGSILGLMVIISLWFFGLGRYNFGLRYNAFFNDPNQMAFWVLCVSAVSMLLAESVRLRMFVLFFAFVLVSLTLSRSGLLGFFPLLAGGFLLAFKVKSIKTILGSIGSLMVVVTIAHLWGIFDQFLALSDRFSSTDFSVHADVRGYNRLLEYPQFLLFGAGKGLDWRFGSFYEIHSTWAGLLFYYGLVGLGIILLMLYLIFSKLTLPEKLIFISPIAYGFGTYGFRTPILWIFLAVFAYVAKKRNQKLNEIHNGVDLSSKKVESLQEINGLTLVTKGNGPSA